MSNIIEKNNKVPQSGGVSYNLPTPPQRKTEEYLTAYKGYPFTAIQAIASELAAIELKLFQRKFTNKGPEATEIFEHEALSVLYYVNPFTTYYDLFEATAVYNELVGEAFWVVLRDEITNTPYEIWMIRPDWVKVVPSKNNFIDHYEYAPGGNATEMISFKPENVIHFKSFNPLNPYRGRGTIQAAAMTLDISDFANQYNRNFFFNGAVPGLVFTTEQRIDKAVLDRFMQSWQNNYGGRQNAHKVAFLGGGFKLEKTSSQAKELDFAEQQRILRDDTLAVFRVPKTVLGLTDDVNRANADATTAAFVARVILPRMRKFTAQLNKFYLPMFSDQGDTFMDFEDPTPEDVEKKTKIYQNALEYGWMTPNEVRAKENLDPIEGGDILLPLAKMAAAEAFNENQKDKEKDKSKDKEKDKEKEGKLFKTIKSLFYREVPEEVVVEEEKPKAFKHMMRMPPKHPELLKKESRIRELLPKVRSLVQHLLVAKDTEIAPKSSGWTEEKKVEYWKRFDESNKTRERKMISKMENLFNEEEAMVLSNLNDIKYWRVEFRKGKESSVLPNKDVIFTIWSSIIVPFIREIVKDEGEEALEDIGQGHDLDMTTENVSKYLRKDSVKLIKDINETTRDELRAALAEGFANNESIDQIKRRVKDVFVEARTSRARNIARTEVIRASNFGTEEGYKQSEVVVAKEWLSQRDQRLCPFCNSMDGKTVSLGKNYFKKGDSLTIEGKTLEFKSLDVSYPPLHPQCRCTLIPVLRD